MDAKQLVSLISQLAVILGGWTVIITGVAVYLSQLATRRIFNEWDKKNQIEIENLRHHQTESQLLLKELSAGLSSSQSQLQLRRIEAIDKLWSIVLELRQNFSLVCFWFEIMYPSEYSLLRSDPKASTDFQSITYTQVIKWSTTTEDIQKYRPYLSEALWQEFFLYRAILGRLGMLIVRIKDGENVEDWREEKMIQTHIKALLDRDEYEEVMNSKLGSVGMTLNLVESKMLTQIGNILSGRHTTMENLKNSLEVQKLIAESNGELKRKY